MQWEKRDVNQLEVKELSRLYGTSLLISSILYRRNILNAQDICYFLEEDLTLLHNPFLFLDMEKAVGRIRLAIEKKEKIFIFGDRDVDGITSTTLLVETLQEFGADVEWGLPIGDEAYGLTMELIAKIEKAGVRLLITVDCGVSNVAEIALAKTKGIETLVVDHHNSQDQLPDTVALLNPKVADCGYPFKDLSACGVVSKLDWALRFSNLPYYGKVYSLINIRPLNEAYLIEGVKLKNLTEIDKIIEHIIPGMLTFEQSRLAAFLKDSEVFVYGEDEQQYQLKKIFGNDFNLPAKEVQMELGAHFPDLKGKSLLKINDQTNLTRYLVQPIKEIDIFKYLFVSLLYKKENFPNEAFIKNLDLVALATLADVMPLVNENRILVKRGLQVINESKRKALRDLLFKKQLYGRKLSPKDIVWQVTPIINASGRMGEPDKAALMFLSRLDSEREQLVDYVMQLNKKRKGMVEKIWNSILNKARESEKETGGKFILVAGKSIHRGITGILATRLVNLFKIPAIVISLLKEKAIGSLRSHEDFNVKNFLCNFGDILSDFGGHDYAAGFSMPVGNLAQFKETFINLISDLDINKKSEVIVQIDAEIPHQYLEPDIFKIAEQFEPYGEANPPLTFLTKEMRILECELIGNGGPSHLKLLLNAGPYKWPAVYWNGYERLGQDFNKYDTADVIYRLTKNFFNNKETMQMVVLDLKKST
jgi:single-stranded-DNA-specific exonuclease